MAIAHCLNRLPQLIRLASLLKKIIKKQFFNNIGLTCNFAELIRIQRKESVLGTLWNCMMAWAFIAALASLSGWTAAVEANADYPVRPVALTQVGIDDAFRGRLPAAVPAPGSSNALTG